MKNLATRRPVAFFTKIIEISITPHNNIRVPIHTDGLHFPIKKFDGIAEIAYKSIMYRRNPRAYND